MQVVVVEAPTQSPPPPTKNPVWNPVYYQFNQDNLPVQRVSTINRDSTVIILTKKKKKNM